MTGSSRDVVGGDFVADDGRRGAHPLELADDHRSFSLLRLAKNLANPFLDAEFPPDCPWVGVRRFDVEPVLSRPGSTPVEQLPALFGDAVERCVGDAGTVAVMFSGGLDSASVLVHADQLCRRSGRRLIAFVWNLTDQFGVPTGQLAHRQIAALQIECDLVVMDTDWRELPDPKWSPHGPRLDYYTRLHHAMTERLIADGADVLLTGIGGDEVLGAWQFMTPDLVTARAWRKARAYLKGFAIGDDGVTVLAELLALGRRLTPVDTYFDLYCGFGFTHRLRPLPQPILQPDYDDAVRELAAGWLRERRAEFRHRDQTWADASLYDSIYPLAHAAHPAGSPLRELSPFLDQEFIRLATGLPLTSRFHAEGPAYHWYKNLHRRLLPVAYFDVAPTYKQSYSHIFREYQLDTMPAGDLACVDLGLVVPHDLRDLETLHPRLPAAVRNVELWLRGALDSGGRPC